VFTVNFDDFTEGEYSTLDKVKDAVETSHAEGVGVDSITEYGEDGSIRQEYGCKWAVEIVPL
jgi:hypothetical protein